jgi:hypothetical protein
MESNLLIKIFADVHKCGIRKPSGINKRILSPSNVGESDFGEWPWQVC